jgi:hypothetical protein
MKYLDGLYENLEASVPFYALVFPYFALSLSPLFAYFRVPQVNHIDYIKVGGMKGLTAYGCIERNRSHNDTCNCFPVDGSMQQVMFCQHSEVSAPATYTEDYQA